MSDDRSLTATGAPSRRLRNRDENGRQVPYVPTEALRARVRSLAKAFPPHSEHLLARMIGISKPTLREHFLAELEGGRAELIASLAGQEIALAMDANAKGPDGNPIAKGDPAARRFVLIKMGGWVNFHQVEVGPPGAFEAGPVDLSRLTEEELEQYGRLSAIAEGRDPDALIEIPTGGASESSA